MKKRMLHRIHVKLLTLAGPAVDVRSNGSRPACELSNFYPHEFIFDGIRCGSMEGFLQALKKNDPERQRLVCSLSRREAKMRSTDTWKKEQTVYWCGRAYNRHGYRFQFLLRRAFREMLKQCYRFRDALLATGNKRIFHTLGNTDPHSTILMEKELCTILTELRDELRHDYKQTCDKRQ